MSERRYWCTGCGFSDEHSWDPLPCPNPDCARRWNIRYARPYVERGPAIEDGERVSVVDVVDGVEEPRIVLGGDLAPVDYVLGGGLVAGTVILLTGAPGIGKSTLALAMLRRVAETLPVLYFTGEESVKRVAARARRLGDFHPRCQLVKEHELHGIIDQLEESGAKVAVVDSVQTISCRSATTGNTLEPGSAACVSIAVAELAKQAQEEEIVIILIGRVTRDGSNAGPRGGLDHAVDVVLTLDGDPSQTARMLTATKNRHGATANAAAHFNMCETGLVPVEKSPQKAA